MTVATLTSNHSLIFGDNASNQLLSPFDNKIQVLPPLIVRSGWNLTNTWKSLWQPTKFFINSVGTVEYLMSSITV